MTFPTLKDVEKADKEQLARWYRFLPPGETDYQLEVINRVYDRFMDLGGWTPGLSKKVGW